MGERLGRRCSASVKKISSATVLAPVRTALAMSACASISHRRASTIVSHTPSHYSHNGQRLLPRCSYCSRLRGRRRPPRFASAVYACDTRVGSPPASPAAGPHGAPLVGSVPSRLCRAVCLTQGAAAAARGRHRRCCREHCRRVRHHRLSTSPISPTPLAARRRPALPCPALAQTNTHIHIHTHTHTHTHTQHTLPQPRAPRASRLTPCASRRVSER